MVDVFISYSRSNRERVRVLADAVKALGYNVWWDDELPPHKSYGDVITEKITDASAAIVCWSADAAQSEWVRAEADLARNQKKLIQTSYDEVMPPMPFNQIQFASLADWQGQADHSGWRKVQASLTDLCGLPGGARPTANVGTTPPLSAAATPPPPAAPPPPLAPSAATTKSALAPLALGAVAGVVLLGAAGLGWSLLGSETRDVPAPGRVEGGGGGGGAAIERPAETDDDTNRYRLAAMIDDPDGYSNIRSGPASDAPVVARVETGEAFTTYEQSGRFWQIRTTDGVTGYMARSRIRLLRDGVPAAPVAARSAEQIPPTGQDEWRDAASDTASRDGQIIADSDTRRLGTADLVGLSPLELRLARNEIFARKGRRFKTPALLNHFSRFAWYRPSADEVTLTPIEQANVDMLSSAERNR